MDNPDGLAAVNGPAAPRDGLEHWLQDLRTGLTDDPPDWINAERDHSAIDPLDAASPPITVGDDEDEPAELVGRHRAPD